MIRIERDPAFWYAVANHPDVRPRIAIGGADFDFALVKNPSVIPLASAHGGGIFLQRDNLGKVYEVHCLWTPEGWGREANEATHEGIGGLFLRGAGLLFTVEIDGGFRVPLSHGWRPAGPFSPSPELAADVRTWVLTQDAWDCSPARRRVCRQQLSPQSPPPL